MIRQKLYVDEYDIVVYAYYATTQYYVEEIMDMLDYAGCSYSLLNNAYNNLSSGRLNTGLTYYSPTNKVAVMVIAKTSSASEFFNSLMHELSHLTAYIAKDEGMSFTGEDIAYLEGGLAKSIFPKVKHLLCDCCRKH